MVAQVTKPVDAELLVATILRHSRERAHTDVEPPPIDWTALDEHYRDKPAFLERLLITVQQAHATTILDLREALRTNDQARIVMLAHSIKGTAGNLMLQSLQALAEDVERAARGGDADMPAGRLVVGVEGLMAALSERLGPVLDKD